MVLHLTLLAHVRRYLVTIPATDLSFRIKTNIDEGEARQLTRYLVGIWKGDVECIIRVTYQP